MSTRGDFQKIYDQVPTGFCKGLCSESCGPIQMTKWERNRITRGDLLPLPQVDQNGVDLCPFLKDDKCSIYDQRPLICRLWGAVDHKYTRCPHGCVPEGGLLTNKKAYEIFSQATAIGGQHVSWHDDKSIESLIRMAQALRVDTEKLLNQ